MYDLTKDITEAYAGESREISVRATFNNNVVLTGENIKSYKIIDSVGGTDSLSLGNACSKRLEMSILVPPELTSIEAAKVQVEIGVDVNGIVEYTPLGLFYVDEVETSDDYKTVEITAYDLMYKIESVLGEKYTCKCTQSEVTALDVIEDICSQAGVTFDRKLAYGYDAYEYADTHWEQSFDLETMDTSTYASWSPTYINSNKVSFAIVVTNSLSMTEDDLSKLSAKVVVTYNGAYAGKDEFTPALKLIDYDNKGQQVSSDTHLGIDLIEIPNVPWNNVSNVSIDIYGFENISGYIGRGFKLVYYTNTSQLNIVNGSLRMSTGTLGNYAPRDVLGYMAGVLGCNATTDRQGNVTLKAFETTDIQIPLEQQFMNGVSKTVATELTIDYITTGSSSEDNNSSNIITIGNGVFGLNFENPFLSPSSPLNAQTAVQNIYDKYKGFTLLSCTVSYRGNPAVDCGDIVQLENADGTYSNVFVLNQTLSVTGGFSGEIDSAIKTDASKDFVSVPPSKKLSYKLDDFVQAYNDIIKSLTGVDGGYVKLVTDSNNKVRAIAITQSDIEVKWDETNKKVVTVDSADKYSKMWVWSYGGLGYTSNGGGSYEVAINMQGQIYANLIVGQLSRFVTLQAERGTIGGWTIEEQDLYKDFTDGTDTYRAYIQGTPSGEIDDIGKTWVFSTQKYIGNDLLEGRFVAKANGNVTAQNINCETVYNRESTDGKRALASNILLVGSNAAWLDGYSFCHKGTADMGQVYVNGHFHLNYTGDVPTTGALYVLDASGRVGTSTSSKRYKENITTEFEENLNPSNLYDLPVVQFNYKSEYDDRDFIKGTQIGFIAEEVEKYYPQAAAKDKNGTVQSWHDRIMIPAMLKLIQDQKKQIDSLEERLSKLERSESNEDN